MTMNNPEYRSIDIEAPMDTWLPLSQAAKFSPYDSEYLSLLARRGKLVAKKIDGIWFTTRGALTAYVLESEQKQEKNKERLRNILSSNTSVDAWLPLSQIAKFSPYDAEYLSLLARKEKLTAKKVDGIWFTTRAALAEYTLESEQKQEKNKERLRSILSSKIEVGDVGGVDSTIALDESVSEEHVLQNGKNSFSRLKGYPLRIIFSFSKYVSIFLIAAVVSGFAIDSLFSSNSGGQRVSGIYQDSNSGTHRSFSAGDSFDSFLSRGGSSALLASVAGAGSNIFEDLVSRIIPSRALVPSVTNLNALSRTSSLSVVPPVWNSKTEDVAVFGATPGTVNNFYGPVTNNYGPVTTTENKYIASPGMSPEVLTAELQGFKNIVLSQVYGAISNISSNVAGNTQAIQLSNRIDQLASVSISGSSFTGGTISNSSITGSNISGGTGSFSTLSISGATTLATTTISGPFTLISSVTSTTENGPLQVNNGVVSATTSIGTLYGGTGINAYTTGDVLYASSANTLARLGVGSTGQVLKIQGGVPVWAADISGGGGAGAWATSTDSLSISPADISNVIIIGASATSTTGNILETVGNSLFRGFVTAYKTVTAPSFTATSSTASIFPYASTTALTVSGNTFLTGLSGPNALAIDANGKVYATATSTLSTISGILAISQGGTGTSTAPSYGKFLVGNATGGYDYVATSSLGSASGVTSLAHTYGSAQTGAITFATSSDTNLLFNVTNSSGAFTFTPAWTGTLASGRLNSNVVQAITNDTNITGSISAQNLTLGWTGQLGATRGGTGLSSIASSSLLIGGPGNTFIGYATSSLGVALGDTTGTLGVSRGGTGITNTPSYGQVLLGNGSGGYTLTATSSLGITGGVWGTITGTLANQTDLQSALDAKLSLSAWYSTTTSQLTEGSNLYYTDARVNTYINASTTIPKTYTANTFTGANTFNSTFTLGTLNGPLQANNGVVSATTSVGTLYGGTGLTAYTLGDILYADATNHLTTLPVGGSGTVLKISGGVPTWGTDLSGGGGSGSSPWATTTSSVAGQLINYSLNTTDLVTIGGSATTTAKYWFDPNAQIASLSGLVGIGTSSPSQKLSVQGNAYTSGTSFFGGAITATSTFTSTATAPNTFPYASTTALTVSGNTFLTGLSGPNGLAINSAGQVYSAATSTLSTISGTLSTSQGGTGVNASAYNGIFGINNGVVYNAATTTYSSGLTYAGGNVTNTGVLSNIAGTGINVSGATGNVTISNSGLLSLQQLGGGSAQTGAITFATSSTAFNGLTANLAITNSSGAFTFAPTLSGMLGVGGGGTGLSSIASSSLLIGGPGNTFIGYATSSLGIALSDTTGTLGVSRGGTATTTFYNGGVTFYNSTLGTLSQGTTQSDFFYDVANKRLGVGTSSPNSKLHVSGDDITLDQAFALRFLRASSGAAYHLLASSVNGAGFNVDIGQSTSVIKNITFSNSAGTSVVVIDSLGNLGIGTTSPYAKLSVDGRGVFNQDIRANYFTATSTSVASIFPYASTTALTVSGNTFLSGLTGPNALAIDANGQIYATATSTLSTISGTLSTSQGGTGVNASAYNGIFGINNGVVYNSATTTYSSGLTYAGGNVTNTGVLSNIAGTGINVSGATGNVTISNSGLLSLQQLGGGSAQTGAITFATSSTAFNGLTANLAITNSSGAFTFAPTLSGMLGVGGGGTGASTFGQGWIYSDGGTGALSASTSPTINYVTATSTTATSTFAAGISATRLNTSATSTFAGILSQSILPNADNAYDLGSPTNRFRDLYLSTASLHLESTAGETGAAKQWKFGIDTGNGLQTGTSTGFFRIQEGSSPMFYLNHAGQVGVGVTDPRARLHIQGNAWLSGFSNGTISSSGTAVTGVGTSFLYGYNKLSVGDQILANGQVRTVVSIQSGTALTIDSAFSSPLSGETYQTQQPIARFDNSAGATKFIIGPGGNIGIGDLNPIGLLSVGAGDAFFINTVGTVASGTWNGTRISPQYGGTGITNTPSYGQVLLGNSSGGYTLTATSSLGITGGVWGTITGTLANQTDLQSALDAKLSLSAWYSTTTSQLTEGSNLYYTDARVNTYINASTTIPKTYTANTFTGANTFNSTFTLGTLNGPLQANNGVVSATTSVGTLYGGTGLTAYTLGDTLYASAANTLARLGIGSGGQVLAVSNGIPSWVATSTLSTISGILAISQGGTGTSTAPLYGKFLVGNATGGYDYVATSSLGSASGVTSLAHTYGSAQTGAITFATSSTAFNGLTSNLAITNTSGAFTFAPTLSGTLGVAGGGTNATSQTTNGVNYFNGTSITSGTGLTFTGTNFGIGSTSPYGRLSVSGAGTDTGIAFLAAGSTNIPKFAILDNGATIIGSSSTAISSSIGFTVQNDPVVGYNGSGFSANMDLRDNSAFTTGVGGGMVFSGQFRAPTSGTDYIPFAAIKGGKENATSANYAGSLGLYTVPNGGAMTERVRISSSGNVGIGSTSPNSLLSIGNTNGINFDTATSTFFATGGIDLKAGCFSINGSCVGAFINTIANGDTGTTTFYNGGVTFYNASLGTLSQAGDGTGLFWDETNKRLGLGTATPAGALSVSGVNSAASATVVGMHLGTQGGTTNALESYNTVGTLFDFSGTSGRDYDFRQAFTPSANTLTLSASTTANQLVLNGNGFVGIGTASPSSKLEVYGTSPSIRVSNTSVRSFDIGVGYASAPSTTFTIRDSSLSADRFAIDASGNVGIGSTSPYGRLSVSGAGTDTGIAFLVAGSTNIPKFAILDNGATIIGSSSTAISSSIGFTVQNDPVVGYNGSGFSANMDLRDNSAFTTGVGGGMVFSGQFRAPTSGTDYIPFAAIKGGKENATSANYAGSLGLYTVPNGGAMTERVRITSAGNVGIGDTTPTNTLDVAGTIGISDTTVIDASRNLVNIGTAAIGSTLQVTGQTTLATSLSGVLKGTSGVVSTGAVNLTSEVTGTLPVSSGGTGWGAIQASAIPYGNGTGALATTTAGTNGQVLAYLNSIPSWVATTTFSSGLTYASGNVTNTGVLSNIAGTGISVSGATGNVTISNTGLLSLAQTYGSAQTGAITFATSSTAINNDWGITNSSGAFTFNIPSASASVRGLLSGTDWSTFNAKQTAGNYITALTGDVTASGPGSAVATIGANKVTLGMLATLSANSIIGNITGSTATPTAIATSSLFTWTGTGDVVRATSATLTTPIFVAPALGTPASGVATNLTGLPLTTGVTGTLPIANGGTNATSQTTNGVNYFNGTSITSGTGLTFTGTNLGIGNTSPSAKLSVTGTGVDTGIAFLVAGSTNIPKFAILDNGATIIGSSSTAISSSIGFTVQNDPVVGYNGSGFSANMDLRDNSAFTTGVGGGMVFSGQFRAPTSGTDYIPFAAIKGGKENATSANYAGSLGLYTVPNGGAMTERVRISSSGNVGIGTTTPVNKLHVNAASQVLGSATPTGGLLVSNLSGSDGVLELGSDATSLAYIQSRNLRSQTYYQLLLNPSGGNVGIGTTSPGNLLDIGASGTNGHHTALNTGNSDTVPFLFSGSGGAGTWANSTFGFGFFNSSTDGDLDIYRKNNSTTGVTAMTITRASGNVGIGTVSPEQKLSVHGTGGSPATSGTTQNGIFRITNNSNNLALDFGQLAGAPYTSWIQNTNSPDLSINYPLALNPNGGSVGIGETSPGTYGTLEIKSAAAASTLAPGNIGLVDSTAQAAGTGGMAVFAGKYTDAGAYTTAGYIRASKTNATTGNYGFDMALGTRINGSSSMSEVMRLTGAGNVGIGSTTPWGQLSVNPNALGSGVPEFVIGSSTATHFIVTGAGNIGIGETTPTERLVVAGQGTGRMLVGDVGFGDGYTGLSMNGVLSTTNYNLLGSPGQAHLWINRASGGDIFFREANSNQVVIKATTGNVGIGTASPADRLSVAVPTGTIEIASFSKTQTTNDTGALVALWGGASGETVRGYLGFAHSGSGADTTFTGELADALQLRSEGAFQLGTNGNNIRLTVASGGNVGIGEAVPGSKLSVSGGATVGASYDTTAAPTNGLLVEGNVGIGTTNPGGLLQVGTTTDPTLATIGLNYSFLNGLRISGSDPYNTIWNAGKSIAITAGSGNTINLGLTSTPTTGLTVNTTSGNVGIGTVAPTAKLHVDVSASSGAHEILSLQTNYGVTGSAQAMTWRDGSNITGQIDTRFDGTTVDMVFGSLYNAGYNSTDRMVIKGNGNVGIGTTSPQAKLDINGSYNILRISTENASSASTNYIRGTSDHLVLNANGTLYLNYSENNAGSTRIGENLVVAQAGGAVQSKGVVYPGNTSAVQSTSYLSGTATGIGIGTVAPQSKFDVVLTGNTTASIGGSIGSGEYAGLSFGYREENTLYRKTAIVYERQDGSARGKIHLLNNGTGDSSSATLADAKLTIQYDGNVGIGTTTPNAKLTISNASDTGRDQLVIESTSNTGLAGIVFRTPYSGTVNEGSIVSSYYNGNPGGMVFTSPRDLTGWGFNFKSNGGTSRMFIDSNTGNVGIGETAPGYKLTVAGTNVFSTQTGQVQIADSASSMRLNIGVGVDSSANKVTWLQSTETGVSNTRNLSLQPFAGNVGIGTTNPNTTLDVQGATLNSDSGAYVNHYRDVAHAYLGGGTQTGTLKIALPTSWTDTMMTVTIKGYDYSGYGAWEVVVGGYNYNGGPYWVNTSAEIRGQAPFTSVRLAHDGTKNVILLGTTATQWNYASVVVSDFVAGYNNKTGWGSGWVMSLITSETGIAQIDTPVAPVTTDSSNNTTFAGTVTTGGLVNAASYLQIDGKYAIDGTDSYLRLNQQNSFSSGTYTPYNLRADGILYTNSSVRFLGDVNTIMNSNQFYCNNSSACYFNNGGTGATNVGNAAGTNLSGAVTGGTYNGQTISSAANFTGTVTLGGNLVLGSNTLTTSNTGLVTNLNADLLDGITSTNLFNNMGQSHGTQTDFNAITDFGARFVQGTTNGPGTGSSQFYGLSLGLGSEYAFSSYALQLAIPRDSSDNYLSKRSREGGTWGAWSKVSAGYADTSGGLTGTPNITVGTITSGLINGQTISSAANFTGTLNAATSLSVGGTGVITQGGNDVYANIRVLRSQSSVSDGMYINYGGTGGSAKIYDGGTSNAVVVGSGGTLTVPSTINASGAITGTSFSGAGTGLTGTASSLTVGALSNFVNQSGSRYTTDFNTLLQTGFYNGEATPANAPNAYGQMIVAKGIDTGLQIAGGYSSDNLYFRGWWSSGAGFSSWRTVLHNGNYASYSAFSGAITGASLSVDVATAGTSGSFTDGVNSSLYIGHPSSGLLNLNVDSGNQISFSDGGVENMRINGSGYVGIANNNPTDALNVGTVLTVSTVDTSANIFSVATSTGTSYFDIMRTGNVGVGTTSPASNFTVVGAACFSGGAGSTVACGTTAGSIYYRSASTGTYDVAENYETSDPTLSAGSIATLDLTQGTTITTATPGSIPLGIISTDPGLTLGGADGGVDSLTRRPLALSGRVPVKVSIENGPIAIGDRLMLSTSTPGIAVKALHSGQSIGIALEAYTGPATGPVEVFVASQYWFSPNDFAIDPNTGTMGIGTTTPINTEGSNYRLAVGGDILATGFVNLSEGDSKADIQHISTTTAESFLDTIRGLMVAEYHYKNEPASAGRVGLIAEEAPQIVRSTKGNGIDLYKLLSVAIGAIQSLAEKVATIGETIAGFAQSFTTENLSANEVRTEKLCVGDTCVSKEELKALLVLAKAGAGTPASAPIDVPADATSGDAVAPTIIINGNNPATISVGDSYADLGASVTDNVDQNLGITTLLDGTETVTVNLDTSAPGTHTITYRATDAVGNTASRTRTVIIEAPPTPSTNPDTPSETP